MTRIMLSVAAVALLAACSPQTEAPSDDSAANDDAAMSDTMDTANDTSTDTMDEAEQTAELGTWGVETQHVSATVEPGDDFFTYVNEGWLDTAEIPQGFSSLSGFTELFLQTEARVQTIIEEAAESGGEGSVAEQQIGNMYASFMDTDRIEELGLSPLQDEIDQVLAAETHEDIARWMGRPIHNSLVGLGVTIDPGDPTRYVLSTGQSGLGLPQRDYYLRDDEPFPENRAAYVDYIEGVFTRANIDRPRERAEAIMALETAIAQVHWTRVETRDRVRNYNLMTIEELQDFAPGFNWIAFMEELGVADQEEIVINTDTSVQGSAQVFAETPVDTWRSYLVFHFINNQAGLLSSEWDEARFDFFARRLNGTEEQRERSLRAIQTVNGRLGELIGQVYVDRHFPPDYKAQMEELVEYLRAAFRDRLETLEWMDDETRAEAFAKLEAFIPKIGYTDHWRDFSSIEVDSGDLIGNSRRVGEWAWADSRSRLGQPIRSWAWFMSPQTVNAYYSSTRNEIVFPAAILQPPFFDPYADPAVNFGAIGGVIGHEMGHGFDDQGSRSDGTGTLRNWWTDFAREQFESRTSVLSAQYSQFSPIEGMSVNGDQTMGENIGDLGGLSIAHHAYQMYLNDHSGGEAPVIDGYTGDQRFFMAWAQVWRTIRTEDSMRNRLLTGVHSPGQYRTNGIVRNMDAWYEAFSVTEDDDLYLPPDQRVSIW